MGNFKITHHCRQRYAQRIQQIKTSKVENYLSHNINVRQLDAKVYNDLERAKECVKHLQIKSIAEYYESKYGIDVKFYTSDKVVYIVKRSEDLLFNLVLTCYPKQGYLAYFMS